MTADPAIRRLVNAVVVPGVYGEAVPRWLDAAIDDGLATVCWFGDAALDELRHHRPDVLVLADEEGGNVTRLEAATGSSFPSHAALGTLDDVAVTERLAAGIGAIARQAGIDVVLAPVVDVNSEPDNPVIGPRSFGDEPELVAHHGAAFVRGVQSRGVAACAKHFPGHGATRTDSHLSLPVVNTAAATFLDRDVAPFRAAVEAGVRCVLTAHVSVPAVDATPATMSATWLGHLRGELEFDGVVLSDALDMHAISRGVGQAVGAVEALRAGVDLVCMGNPEFPERYDGEAAFGEIGAAIAAAVGGGTLSIDRLEEAAARLDSLRAWVGARTTPDTGHDAAAVRDAHLLGLDVSRRTARSLGDTHLEAAPCVVVERHLDIPAGQSSSPLVAALARRAPATTSVDVRSASDVAELSAVRGEQPCVLVTDGLGGDAVVRAVRESRPDAIVVHVGTPPADLSSIGAPAVIARDRSAASAEAVAELLWEQPWR